MGDETEMSDCISYGVTITKRDGADKTEYFEELEEAEEAFEEGIEELDPNTYTSVELIRMDWYERSGESLDYYAF